MTSATENAGQQVQFPPLISMIPGPVVVRSPHLHSLKNILLLLFWLSIWIAPAQAQTSADDVHITPRQESPKPPKKQLPETSSTGAPHTKPLISNVDLVLVPVTVIDSMNHAVTSLQKENFKLYEDNQQQVIGSFYSEDSPISLGVIFDTSKSMSNKIQKARESVVEFFKTANAQDDFFVIAFSDRPELLVDFTNSVEHIQNSLVNAVPHGHTSLLDAIYMGVSKVRHARHQRRALLIISDGGDNSSRYTRADIKRMVEEADVQLYGIGIFDTVFTTLEERLGEELMDFITEATGGHTFAVKDIDDLPRAAKAIATELRNQYVLGYRSSNPARDAKWRKIKVKVTSSAAMPQLHVYAKSGYYAPAE